jgi:hypothetical protein
MMSDMRALTLGKVDHSKISRVKGLLIKVLLSGREEFKSKEIHELSIPELEIMLAEYETRTAISGKRVLHDPAYRELRHAYRRKLEQAPHEQRQLGSLLR